MNHKMKQWFIYQSINHPKRTIFFSVLLTLLIASGIRFVEMEDDMLKLLPDDIESTITWDAVQEEFGNTNLMFVAYGRRDQSVYNADMLSTLFDFSHALEDLPQVDEVISIATLNRMDSDDGFMEISDLQPYRDLSPEEINDIKLYLSSWTSRNNYL